MKIGFDAKRAFSNFTGLGNYSRSTLKVLAEHHPEHSYYLYNPRVPNESQIKFLDLPHHADVHIRIPKTFFFELFSSAWRRYGILKDLKKDQLDIYHGLSHELPLGIEKTKIKSVVTIHDLIFLRFPEYYKLADRKIYEAKFRHACEVADLIIAISEQTKKDIIHFFQIPAHKIRVVYQSCAKEFNDQVQSELIQKIKNKYQLPDRFILTVGTIEKRKNALLIVKALQKLEEDVKLVIIGRATPYTDELKTYAEVHGLINRIIFLHQIPFEELPSFYHLASVFAYPSRYEGFGIPIIEALQCGTPVIAAKGSCLEEAGGPSSIYIHADDADALATSVKILLSEGKNSERVKSGKLYAKQFMAENIANDYMKIYKELIQQN